MPARDKNHDALAIAYGRVAGYKPSKSTPTLNALSRLAKTQGLSDDTREIIWTVRHSLRHGAPLTAAALLEREMNRRV